MTSEPRRRLGTAGFQIVSPSTTGKLRALRVDDVELLLDSRVLRIDQRIAHLPLREFQVLQLLMDNAGRVVSRTELLHTCWGPDQRDTGKTLDVHITRLRRKLRALGRPHQIRTVYGAGYIYDLPA
jgi:two-component system response regulator RegX3